MDRSNPKDRSAIARMGGYAMQQNRRLAYSEEQRREQARQLGESTLAKHGRGHFLRMSLIAHGKLPATQAKSPAGTELRAKKQRSRYDNDNDQPNQRRCQGGALMPLQSWPLIDEERYSAEGEQWRGDEDRVVVDERIVWRFGVAHTVAILDCGCEQDMVLADGRVKSDGQGFKGVLMACQDEHCEQMGTCPWCDFETRSVAAMCDHIGSSHFRGRKAR